MSRIRQVIRASVAFDECMRRRGRPKHVGFFRYWFRMNSEQRYLERYRAALEAYHSEAWPDDYDD